MENQIFYRKNNQAENDAAHEAHYGNVAEIGVDAWVKENKPDIWTKHKNGEITSGELHMYHSPYAGIPIFFLEWESLPSFTNRIKEFVDTLEKENKDVRILNVSYGKDMTECILTYELNKRRYFSGR